MEDSSAEFEILVYDSYEMVEHNASVKRIAVLGSTGSIGRQTLEVVRALPDKFKVIGLAAGDNTRLLEKQIQEFKPQVIYYRDRKIKIHADGYRMSTMEEIAVIPEVDILVVATSGRAALSAVMAAIKAGKKIALSNKEPLVMAGEIIMAEVKKSRKSQAEMPVALFPSPSDSSPPRGEESRNEGIASEWHPEGSPAIPFSPLNKERGEEGESGGAEILPVDSEHSAIWQCLRGETAKPARLILTASGGPFLRYSPAQMADVTIEQALKHPSWKMGKKVTIDSATLMNKGLEVIEAHWLFDMPYDKIDVLVHPQSIVHSMIQMEDGSIKAQMSYPDMRFPIQYALLYPERLPNPTLPKLDWGQIGSLKFESPDYDLFPCLKLAIEAGRRGGTYPAVLCAADEIAVDLFLKKQIHLTDIARLIEQVLGRHQNTVNPKLEDILAADEWGRAEVNKCLF